MKGRMSTNTSRFMYCTHSMQNFLELKTVTEPKDNDDMLPNPL